MLCLNEKRQLRQNVSILDRVLCFRAAFSAGFRPEALDGMSGDDDSVDGDGDFGIAATSVSMLTDAMES